MFKKQNIFLSGSIIIGIYGALLKDYDLIISACIVYISIGVWLKGICDASTEINKAKAMYSYIENLGIFCVYYVIIFEILEYHFNIPKNDESLFSWLGAILTAPIIIGAIISLYKVFKVRNENENENEE